MQALYLVIFQMQQSSAKIKFIRFSMDIAVHFPPFCSGVRKRQRREVVCGKNGRGKLPMSHVPEHNHATNNITVINCPGTAV